MPKPCLKIAILLTVVLAINTQTARAQDRVAIARKAKASGAVVFCCDVSGRLSAMGSGFFVASDSVLSCYHLINEAIEVYVKVDSGRILRVSSVSAYDKNTDLCILKVRPSNIPQLTIANRDPKVGETVYAFGNPLELEGTFTEGIISAKRAVNGIPCFQFSAPADLGSSGGPLLNSKGEAVGVIASKVGNSSNFSFAISRAVFPELPTGQATTTSLRRLFVNSHIRSQLSPELDMQVAMGSLNSPLLNPIYNGSLVALIGLKELKLNIDGDGGYGIVSARGLADPEEYLKVKEDLEREVASKLSVLGIKCRYFRNDAKPKVPYDSNTPTLHIDFNFVCTSTKGKSLAELEEQSYAHDFEGNLVCIAKVYLHVYRQSKFWQLQLDSIEYLRIYTFSVSRKWSPKNYEIVQDILAIGMSELMANYLMANSDYFAEKAAAPGDFLQR